MAKCSNCGAEVPVDATFCESCGAKVALAAAAPPSPPSAYPSPPPAAAAPPAEKAGPPMKIIAIAVVVIVIVLGGVLFLASSATSGLELSLQSGNLTTDYGLYSLTITLTLNIDNPSFLPVEVTNDYINIKLRAAGREDSFFTGSIYGLRGSYSGSTMKTVIITIPLSEWYTSSNKYWIWHYGAWTNISTMELSMEGTLDTKCLFMTGTTTVNIPYKTITAW